MFRLTTHDVYQEIQIQRLPTLLSNLWQWQAILYTRDGTKKEQLSGFESGHHERMDLRDKISEILHEHFDEKYPPNEE